MRSNKMNRISASRRTGLRRTSASPGCKLLERQTNHHRQESHLGDLPGHLEQRYSLDDDPKQRGKHSQDDRGNPDSKQSQRQLQAGSVGRIPPAIWDRL